MRTTGTAITGWGVWHPPTVLTNEELCTAFNEYVRRTGGDLQPSSPEFIVKASGIERRYVEDKSGLTDPDRMWPNIPERGDDQLSIQAEYAKNAGERALACAGRTGADLGFVVLGASSLQRAYPALAIEAAAALGSTASGVDIQVGCSTGTAAIQLASNAVAVGQAAVALVVLPELTSPHLNWRERDGHFILGDAAVALVIEPVGAAKHRAWDIQSLQMGAQWSSNIRNNFGFINRAAPGTEGSPDKLFYQQGRRVFKDVVPMAEKFIAAHLAKHELSPDDVQRYWLHQANKNMNDLIAKRVLGREATASEAPLVLAEYGNTASAGSLIAFALHNEDLPVGSRGLLASFGAGYSLGSAMLQRTA